MKFKIGDKLQITRKNMDISAADIIVALIARDFNMFEGKVYTVLNVQDVLGENYVIFHTGGIGLRENLFEKYQTVGFEIE
jgi:hypothetical protein